MDLGVTGKTGTLGTDLKALGVGATIMPGVGETIMPGVGETIVPEVLSTFIESKRKNEFLPSFGEMIWPVFP